MSRWKKSIVSLIVVICVCTFSVCSFSFDSHAYGDPVYLNYPEPATSDSQGYLIVGLDNDGESQVATFSWSLSSENLTQDTIEKIPMNISIGTNYVQFSITVDTDDDIWSTGYISYYNYQGKYRVLKTYNLVTPSEVTYKYSFSSSVTVNSFIVSGGVGSFSYGSTSYVSPPTVVFSGGVYGADVIDSLDSILAENKSIDSTVTEIFDTIDYYYPEFGDYLADMDSLMLEYFPDFSNKMVFYGDYLAQIDSSLDLYLPSFKTLLTQISAKLSGLIDTLSTPTAEDEALSDEYAAESDSQSNALDQATQDSQTEKVDADEASGTIDSTLDFDAVGEYSGVLAVITNNTTVVTMLLIVMVVALISYVLFGKR